MSNRIDTWDKCLEMSKGKKRFQKGSQGCKVEDLIYDIQKGLMIIVTSPAGV